MHCEEEVIVNCPSCGEPHLLIVDCTMGSDEYTEDCSVCCRPIIVSLEIDSDALPQISVRNENE